MHLTRTIDMPQGRRRARLGGLHSAEPTEAEGCISVEPAKRDDMIADRSNDTECR